MNNKRIGSYTGLWLFFLAWPFGAFILSLKHIINRHYQKIIIAFAFLFGYTVFFYGGDIVRYQGFYKAVSTYSWSEFFRILFNPFDLNIQAFYSGAEKPDRYAFILQFIFSRLTENSRWMFGFISAVFTALYLRFMNEVLKETKWVNNNFAQKIFFVFLLVVIPFYVGVTGIRFWTALFVFMLFTIRYVKTEGNKYILYAASSMFIHYSFFLPLLILIIYKLTGYKKNIVALFVLVGILSFINGTIGTKINLLQQVTTPFENTTIFEAAQSYTDYDILQERHIRLSQTNWYVTLRSNLLLFFLLTLTLLEYLRVFKFRETAFTKKLFPIVIFFFIFTILTIDMGSLGRFNYIFYLFAISRYIILIGRQPNDKKLKYAGMILFPILVLWILVIARGGFYFVDPLLLVGNPIILFLEQSSISLSELLVGH